MLRIFKGRGGGEVNQTGCGQICLNAQGTVLILIIMVSYIWY